MASFLDELGMTLFNQQEMPEYNQVSSADLVNRAQGLLPQMGAFNQQYAQQLGLIPIENQIRGARFGQAINPLQEAYTSNILNNLNLGNALPEDVQQQAIRGALQGAAASGFGLSPGGRALAARDLGLTSLEVGRQRRGEALNTLQAFRGEGVREALSPVSALQMERASIDEANFQRQREAGMRGANRQALMTSIYGYAKAAGDLAGSAVGSAAGSAFGTKGWGEAGSGILKGIGGAAGSSGGGGGITSGGGGTTLQGGSVDYGVFGY